METELEKLRTENERLKSEIQELEQISKMLVRRDIDLREAYENLKKLDKEKSEFVSIAAHQLRTPLTSVSFANQVLTDAVANDLNEEQLSLLSKSKTSIKNMFTIIEDLLVIDALDYGNLQLSYESLEVESLVIEIVDSLKEIIQSKSIELVLDLATNRQPVSIDGHRMKDAISNFIDNAVKYTPEGGRVTISSTYENSLASVRVSDSGIGVPEEDVPNLFKKFSRLENARRVDANGSGLGLYISKKIVEKHKGTVEYEPNQPNGSSFTINIPL